jgi:hypothetical protein
VLSSLVFGAQDILPLTVRQQISRHFTRQEIESVEKLLSSAGQEGLPVRYLLPRLTEAATKRVPYTRLEAVLCKKLDHMRHAYALIWKQLGTGRRTEKLNEDICLLAEFLERGLADDEWDAVLAAADKRLLLEEVLERVRQVVLLKEVGYPANSVKEIVSALLPVDPAGARTLVDLLRQYPSIKAKDIVLKGVRDRKNSDLLEKELQASYRAETIKEVLYERRPER